MKTFFKIELKRCLRSKTFWVALVISCVLALCQYVDNVLPMRKYLNVFKDAKVAVGTITPHTVFNKWIGGEDYTLWHYAFFMVLPILAAMPLGASLFLDVKSGIVKNYFIRSQKEKYYAAKYLMTFLSSGFVIFFGVFLNLFLASMTLPSILPEASTGTYYVDGTGILAELFYSKPYVYCVIYLAMIFVFSGLIGCLSLSVGTLADNVFTIILLPFVLYLFLYAICIEPSTYGFSPINFLNPAQGEGYNHIWMIVLELLILIVTNVILACKGIRDEVY